MITLTEKVSRSFRFYYYGIRNKWNFPHNMSHFAGGNIGKGSYEPEVTELLHKYLKPGSVFLDVGANVGYFSRLAGEIVGGSGKIFSIEANANNFLSLFRNTNHYPNIHPFNVAIADKNSFLDLNISSHSACHSLMQTNNNLNGKTSKVFSITLDHFWEDYLEKQTIDLLKIDIEGAEIQALNGMQKLLSQGNGQHLIIEYCPDILKNAGFEVMEFYNKLSPYFSISIVEKEYQRAFGAKDIVSPEDFRKLTDIIISKKDAVNINLLCSKKES